MIMILSENNCLTHATPFFKPEFHEKLSLYRKTIFGHALGCGAVFYGERGSVSQCVTKGKVYGCKLNLNHRQKPAVIS